MRYNKIFAVLIFLYIIFYAGLSHARIYIDIGPPRIIPFPIAISRFNVFENPNYALDTDNIRLALEAEKILLKDLKLTGFLEIFSFEDFPKNVRESFSIDKEQNINFDFWNEHPAEALVLGSAFTEDGEKITVQFRLYDLIRKESLTGLRFRGHMNDLYQIIHNIADEIIFHITGIKGVFQTKLCFCTTKSGNKEICSIDFDGRNWTSITQNGSINLSPSWSPDSTKISFTSYMKRNPDLYVLTLSDQSTQKISSKEGLNAGASWSPDGKSMAVMMRDGDYTKIFLMNQDGSHPTILTTKSGNEASPTWSPDGKSIALVSDRSGTPQIYIVDLDTRKMHRLTYEGTYNVSPSWSPNGERIAYSSMEENFNIFTINIEGNIIWQLTDKERNNEDPTWSPDGRFIAFTSDRTGRKHIYVMNTNGSNQRQLTFSHKEEMAPDWSSYLNSK
ncbi:MAG: Tol-Pal system beta propeller repeat protein TolB [bacterium]